MKSIRLAAVGGLATAYCIVGVACGKVSTPTSGGSVQPGGAAGGAGGAPGGAPLPDPGTAPQGNPGAGTPPAPSPDPGGVQAGGGGTDSTPPPDVPALRILAPEDAPARPVVDPDCPSAPPVAAVHYPGPTTITELNFYSGEVRRTQQRWASGILVAETTDDWSEGEFNRTTIARTLTARGTPLRAVAMNQLIYGTTPAGRRATAGFTDFLYDADGRLVGTENKLWVLSGLQPAAPWFGKEYHDDVLTDSLGRVFLVDRKLNGDNDISPALDKLFLFTQVPFADAWDTGISLSLHPNGVLESYTISRGSSWGTEVMTQSYDDRGVLQKIQNQSWLRGSGYSDVSTLYTYERGRIASVDMVDTSKPGAQPLEHAVFSYDANGNNVARTITRPAGEFSYLAIYDTANNLICERLTGPSVGVQPTFVRHYDFPSQ
jgi:hypothetical protein